MKLSRALSFAFLPWTLPFDLSVNFSKRLLDILPKFTVPTSSPGLLNMFFVYFNLLVQKLTYEKYHYHARYESSAHTLILYTTLVLLVQLRQIVSKYSVVEYQFSAHICIHINGKEVIFN